MGRLKYYALSILQAVFTLWAVVTISFWLYRLMPGNPLQAMRATLRRRAAQRGEAVDPERINRLVEARTGINPDIPIWQQYLNYLADVIFKFDFGESIWHSRPVFELLFAALPWTVFISIYGLFIGWTANIILGALMAYKEGSRFDSGSTFIAIVLTSTPYYVGAIALLATVAYQLNWFPTGGRYPSGVEPGFTIDFMTGILHHAALPILSSVLIGFGGAALAMRGNAIREMGEEYVRVGRLRGLNESRLALTYVGRNAILPLYTAILINISALFSSSIILEGLFNYPGVGWYTYGALTQRDYPLLMGIFIFYTVITLIGILLADFTYGLIDPRAGQGDRESY